MNSLAEYNALKAAEKINEFRKVDNVVSELHERLLGRGSGNGGYTAESSDQVNIRESLSK